MPVWRQSEISPLVSCVMNSKHNSHVAFALCKSVGRRANKPSCSRSDFRFDKTPSPKPMKVSSTNQLQISGRLDSLNRMRYLDLSAFMTSNSFRKSFSESAFSISALCSCLMATSRPQNAPANTDPLVPLPSSFPYLTNSGFSTHSVGIQSNELS